MKPKRIVAIWAGLLIALEGRAAESAELLPNTKPLEWPEKDLSARLMDGAHRFVERKVDESITARTKLWSCDFASPEAFVRSVEPNRQRFKTIIGAVDARLTPRMERFGDDANPALVAETSRYRIYQVRWPVLDGLFGTGLLVQPKRALAGCVVVVADADEMPEQLMGLAGEEEVQGLELKVQGSQGGRVLAEN